MQAMTRAIALPWSALISELTPPMVGIRRSPAFMLGHAVTHSAYLEGAECLLMGATFPLRAVAVVRHGTAGQQTRRLYAMNTLASVVGSLGAGFLLLPDNDG